MKKIKFLIVGVGIMFSIVSCKKDISLEPVYFESTSFSTEPQLAYQLAALYNPLQADALYGQGLWGYLEAGTDESFRNGINGSSVFTELYNIASTETNIGNFWRQLYNGVERANTIIDAAPRIDMDSTKRANIIGQSKFLRAFYYYLLESRFGGVEGIPIKAQLSTEMGTNFNIPRTSGKQVYDYIISEMTEAETMVPAINAPQAWQSALSTPTVVSKSAVQAVLARVCLAAAGNPINDNTKYQLALTWAQKLINANVHALNSSPLPTASSTPAYARLFINNVQNNANDQNITEGIWDAAFLSKSNATGTYANTGFQVTQTLGAIMGVYCPDASATSLIGFSSGTYRVHNRLYRLYASGDLRRDWAIAPFVYKTTGSTTRYPTLGVLITGGGGTGATATAYTNATGGITSVVIDNAGNGYTSAPTITFVGFATNTTTTTVGTGAVATATISGGKLTAINVTTAGSAYPTTYERCVGKWRREYEVNIPPTRLQNNTSTNFPIIRYADVLLMAAEADLKVNGSPSATAIEYFNQVRRRAFGVSPTAANATTDVTTFTMQDIMDERSRELCFEGVRRADLVRWGTMTTAMQNTQNDVRALAPTSYQNAALFASTNYLLNPSKYALFPIPAAFEIAQNTALTQNAGW
jgi:starch-binding outer membrane protein, SusD/RagB family